MLFGKLIYSLDMYLCLSHQKPEDKYFLSGEIKDTTLLTLVMLDPHMGEPIPWDQGYCGSSHEIRRVYVFEATTLD